MQLLFHELTAHLKESLSSCYLLHGDEWLLAEEGQMAITNAAAKKGFSAKQTFYIQQESDWSSLKSETDAFDLFSQKRIFLVRYLLDSITKSAQAFIQTQLNNLSSDQVHIILTPKIKKPDQKKSWYQLFVKQGVVIPIYELKGFALQKWVQNKFYQSNIKTSNKSILDQVIRFSEGNLLALNQSIQKLKLLFPNETLTSKHINSVLFSNERFNVFQFIDALLSGEAQKALQILNYLFEINHPPLLILWAVTRQLRELITLAQQLSNGVLIADILKSQWSSRRMLVRNALLRLSCQDLEKLLLFCSKIDKMIKKVNITDARKALDVLVVRFYDPKFLKR